MRADVHLVLQICISLCASIASSAAVYTFSLFAPALRHAPFNYSEADISTVAAFFVCATFLNMPAGYLFDHFGPRVTIGAGGVLMTVAWLCVAEFVLNPDLLATAPSRAVVTLCFMGPTFAGSFLEVGNIMGHLDIFKLQTGFIIVVLKTFIGLGCSIVSAIFGAFYAPYVTRLLEQNEYAAALGPFGDFAKVLAVFSFVSVSLTAFIIEYDRRRKWLPGMTAPPASASVHYRAMMTRGEHMLYLGIVLLTFGNLVVVWSERGPFSRVMHVTLALAGIVFPFLFLFMLRVLPAVCTADMPEYNNKLAGGSGDDDVEQRQQQQQNDEQEAAREREQKNNECKNDNKKGHDESSNHVTTNSSAGGTIEMKMTMPEEVVEDAPADNSDDAADVIDDVFDGIFPNKDGTSGSRFKSRPCDLTEVYHPEPPQNRDAVFFNATNKVELALLWVISFCVWGCTSMMYANSSSIYRALPGRGSGGGIINKFDNSLNAAFVACIGVGNALGRVIAGKSVAVLQARGLPLTRLLLFPPVLTGLAASLLLVTEGGALALPFFLTGFAVGLFWGSLILMVNSIFVSAGQHYAALYTAGAITPFVFIRFLFKTVYAAGERAAEEGQQQRHDSVHDVGGGAPLTFHNNSQQPLHHPSASSCIGHGCIAVSMWVAIGLCAASFLLAIEFNRRFDRGCLSSDLRLYDEERKSHQQIVETEVVAAAAEPSEEGGDA